MIDTADSYQNEKSVGEGIRNTGVPREEIFLTTKSYMMVADGYAFAKNAFPKVLERLGVDYIDMYMIHMPFADYYGAWRAMEEFYKQGRIRVLGVCNFSSANLVDFQRNWVPWISGWNRKKWNIWKNRIFPTKSSGPLGPIHRKGLCCWM